MSEEIDETEVKIRISDLISQHVNTEKFMVDLTATIMSIENDTNRAKLMFELLSYSEAKIKAIDKDNNQSIDGITINFIEATPDDVEDED